MKSIEFLSHGVACAAWHLPARNAELTTSAGRPCVVMAHGFGCTRDGGLLPFAQRFADAGADVLVFDYRGYGTSAGTPRQDVDRRRHRQDYHAAVAAARSMPGVDADRIVLWGTSYSGGHVIAVAARDARIAAVISQGAAMDGVAALAASRARAGSKSPAERSAARHKSKAMASAIGRDLWRRVRSAPPVLVPVFGEPGSDALVITDRGAAAFQAILGPTFRNEMCARGLLRIAVNRPVRLAGKVTCPTLLVVAERDEVAPAACVHEVARRIGRRAETLSFDSGHFEIYVGDVFEQSVAAQTSFLARQLGATQAAHRSGRRAPVSELPAIDREPGF